MPMGLNVVYPGAILRDYLLREIGHCKNVWMCCNAKIEKLEKQNDCFVITLLNGDTFSSDFVLNATYASTNQILAKLRENPGDLDAKELEPFSIKYELCEIILCEANEALKGRGITVMDGPFFSIMPFGKTGLHSLTSVTFTPHSTSISWPSSAGSMRKGLRLNTPKLKKSQKPTLRNTRRLGVRDHTMYAAEPSGTIYHLLLTSRGRTL